MKYYLWNDYTEDKTYCLELIISNDQYQVIDNTVFINLRTCGLIQQIFFTPADSSKIFTNQEQSARLEYFQTDAKQEFNFICHLLKRLNDVNAVNSMTFHKLFFRSAVLSGRYGENACEQFRNLQEREQEILLYYLVLKDADENRFPLLIQAVKDLFEKVIPYYDDFQNVTYLFTTSPETEYNQKVLQLAVFFFQEFFINIEIVWSTQPIFIGESTIPSIIPEHYNLF
jgi:hypothetical protein